MSDLVRALAVLAEPPGERHAEIAALLDLPAPTRAEHTDLFVLQLYPYASVHLGPEGKLGGEARDRVAGLFRALGDVPPPEPDHLVVLLGAYAELAERERDDDGGPWSRARATLLAEHLLSWVPGYLRRVRGLGGAAYRGWAQLLDEVLADEAVRTSTAAGLLPAHLETAPPLPDPRGGDVGAFVEGLLAPVRVGMTLTASDLARAAADLGLGRRVGERRFVLRSLLDQDAAGVLAWLAAAARAEARATRVHWHGTSSTGRWWARRAEDSAGLLDELADEAGVVEAHLEDRTVGAT